MRTPATELNAGSKVPFNSCCKIVDEMRVVDTGRNCPIFLVRKAVTTTLSSVPDMVESMVDCARDRFKKIQPIIKNKKCLIRV
jgi:hypothetical protein